MALLANNEPIGARFMNNRPLSVSDEIALDGSGTSEHTTYFHIVDPGSLIVGGEYVTLRQVILFIYGYGGGGYPEESHQHPSVGNHNHSNPSGGDVAPYGSTSANGAHSHGNPSVTIAPASTTVPKYVEIWIDGVDRTSDIGNPNSKPNYSAGNGWGDDGTTAWSTGRLDVTNYVDTTVTGHYITIKETGGEGGRVQFCLYIT